MIVGCVSCSLFWVDSNVFLLVLSRRTDLCFSKPNAKPSAGKQLGSNVQSSSSFKQQQQQQKWFELFDVHMPH